MVGSRSRKPLRVELRLHPLLLHEDPCPPALVFPQLGRHERPGLFYGRHEEAGPAELDGDEKSDDHILSRSSDRLTAGIRIGGDAGTGPGLWTDSWSRSP